MAIRGLMKQKLDEGDTTTALKLAEKAFALKPGHSGTQDILLKLQSEQADWKGARATLSAQARSGADGHVGAAEQRRVQAAQTQQSHRVYRKKHNAVAASE